MNRKLLGKTGISIPPICFGSLTMSPLQLNFEPQEGGEVVCFAAQQGIDFIDTAQYYRNYPILAYAVKNSKKDLIITSKTYAYTAKDAVAAVEQARKEIGRDYIDIFLLHEQESEHTLRGHREALDALYDLKARGIIRAVGLSTHFVAGVKGAVKHGLDVVHPMLNIEGLGICDGSRQDMELAVKEAYEAGLGVYAMKALGGGNLYARAEECLNYIFSLDYINSVAIGMKSNREILDNLSFYEKKSFTSEYKTEGKAIHIEEYCTGCGMCVEKCSQQALKIQEGKCVCDKSKCLLCGYCSAACPEFGIKIL